MTYYKGKMLLLKRQSAVTRHALVSEWSIIDCIDFDSSDNNNMNFLHSYPRAVMVPTTAVTNYHNNAKIVVATFDPVTSTQSWHTSY